MRRTIASSLLDRRTKSRTRKFEESASIRANLLGARPRTVHVRNAGAPPASIIAIVMHHIHAHLREKRLPAGGTPCHMRITDARIAEGPATLPGSEEIIDYGKGMLEVLRFAEGRDPLMLDGAYPYHLEPLQQWAKFRSTSDTTPVLLSVVIGKTTHCGVLGLPGLGET